MDPTERRPIQENSIAPRRPPARSGRAAGAGGRDPLAGVFTVVESGGERRYYNDPGRKSLALTATDRTIRTEREDRTTVAAMVALAAARRWTAVEITGSAAFRREAWIEARARGLAAHGHDPTAAERREAERHAGRALSADGRLVLAALADTIERRMNRIGAGAKAELTAFAAAELARRERTRGPVALTAEQRRAARAPAPAPPTPEPPGRERRAEPDPPQRRR